MSYAFNLNVTKCSPTSALFRNNTVPTLSQTLNEQDERKQNRVDDQEHVRGFGRFSSLWKIMSFIPLIRRTAQHDI